MTEISVVILCYGAGRRIYNFVNRTVKLLDRFITSWEIVLVGNYNEGMDDETPGIVKEIASKNEKIKAVVMPKQGRMGWDARSGLKAATGKYICLIDPGPLISAITTFSFGLILIKSTFLPLLSQLDNRLL